MATVNTAAYASGGAKSIPFPVPLAAEPIQITSDLLEQALLSVVGMQLEKAGFTHAEKGAVHWLEDTVVHLVRDLFEMAKERAEGTGRARANVIDLWDVIEEDGLLKGGVDALAEVVKGRRGQPARGLHIDMQVPLSPEPTLDTLEGHDAEVVLLPYAPSHAPPLPATHTYVFSRPPPPRIATSLTTLNAQVEESRLAESSLRKLMKSLEEESGPMRLSAPEPTHAPNGSRASSDTGSMPPPFGLPPLSVADMAPVVNWERGRMTGRKWKVGG